MKFTIEYVYLNQKGGMFSKLKKEVLFDDFLTKFISESKSNIKEKNIILKNYLGINNFESKYHKLILKNYENTDIEYSEYNNFINYLKKKYYTDSKDNRYIKSNKSNKSK
jgi:hypothetical protein